MSKVKPIPDGFHTLTPHIIVRDAEKSIEFYKNAFGAEDVMVMPGPDGKGVMHAEIKIGNSILMIAEENPDWKCLSPLSVGGSSVTIHVYVEDVDAVFDRAVKAGAKVEMPVENAFWGDRYGQVSDPSGHRWSIATHKEELTAEQITEAAKKAFSGGSCSD